MGIRLPLRFIESYVNEVKSGSNGVRVTNLNLAGERTIGDFLDDMKSGDKLRFNKDWVYGDIQEVINKLCIDSSWGIGLTNLRMQGNDYVVPAGTVVSFVTCLAPDVYKFKSSLGNDRNTFVLNCHDTSFASTVRGSVDVTFLGKSVDDMKSVPGVKFVRGVQEVRDGLKYIEREDIYNEGLLVLIDNLKKGDKIRLNSDSVIYSTQSNMVKKYSQGELDKYFFLKKVSGVEYYSLPAGTVLVFEKSSSIYDVYKLDKIDVYIDYSEVCDITFLGKKIKDLGSV